MSTIYNGNGSLVSATNRNIIGISSSTNASPIVVTTSGTPGWNTGDTVEVEGHLVNTNANGLWQITKVTSSTFALNGSTGNGVGGATGYGIDYELKPAITIPANGELADMGTLGAALEGLANPAPFLYRATGKYRLFDTYYAANTASAYNSIWSTNSGVSNTTFATLASATALLGAPGIIANTGDMLEVTFSNGFVSTSGSQYAAIALGISYSGGAYAALPESTQWISSSISAIAGPTLFGLFVNIGSAAPFDFALMGKTGTTSPSVNVNLNVPYAIFVKHWRAN